MSLTVELGPEQMAIINQLIERWQEANSTGEIKKMDEFERELRSSLAEAGMGTDEVDSFLVKYGVEVVEPAHVEEGGDLAA